jgi:hypothetical protein
MGRIVKQVSGGMTKYYWYPGDKKEWVRAGVAIGAGVVAFAAVSAFIRDALVATVVGASLTAALAGFNFGRRDARALAGFPDLGDKAARRAAMGHTGRAAWRALVEGFIGAAAAVVICNLPHGGLVADWIMPVVPAIVGALAQQGGMLYERLSEVGRPPKRVGLHAAERVKDRATKAVLEGAA